MKSLTHFQPVSTFIPPENIRNWRLEMGSDLLSHQIRAQPIFVKMIVILKLFNSNKFLLTSLTDQEWKLGKTIRKTSRIESIFSSVAHPSFAPQKIMDSGESYEYIRWKFSAQLFLTTPEVAILKISQKVPEYLF